MTQPAAATINTDFGAIAMRKQAGRLKIDLLTTAVANKQSSSDPDIGQSVQEILAYLQQAHDQFSLPATLSGSPFQEKVWRAIAAIPLGQTRSYSELAAQLHSGPRAVANACGANRLPLLIPCHRVVGKNGLGGFMQGQENGLTIKRWLLAHEGVHDYR